MFNKKKAKVLSSEEIRERFLKFFEKKNHYILSSASLVPENDPSVLFNTAGMQPLVPYLLGEKHPQGKRLVSSQKCVRTNDIDEVGDRTHLTFFEMLGNWSLGDYFKEEAIRWSYEFLTSTEEGLGLDPKRIYVTVFLGNDQVPKDNEAFQIWKEIVGEKRIYFTEKDNWWSAGENGPSGPDSEIFYDLTEKGLGNLSTEEFFAADDKQDLIEIWNDVFMEYESNNGKIVGRLKNKNIDTGAGLERLTTIIQRAESPFETDLFNDILIFLENNSKKKYLENKREFRIVADHLRTAVFLIADGVLPSNKDQGYVLRRLLRRALVKMNDLNKVSFSKDKIEELLEIIINKYEKTYPDLRISDKKIKQEITLEIEKFSRTLEKGMKEFRKIIDPEIKNNHICKLEFGMCETDGYALNEISGEDAFKLFTTFGFPIELIIEEAKSKMMIVDTDGFKKLLAEHQKKSQTASVGKFKGGLSGDSKKTRALHTVTHLLLAGLRKFLGKTVGQKGSNITEERIRFDFSYPEKVSRDILNQVENFVNEVIARHAEVSLREIKKSEARADENITGAFWDKYPELVKVYSIVDETGKVYSQELCNGPHVENTEEIAKFGKFKIVKEESSSAGVRRIKAVLDK